MSKETEELQERIEELEDMLARLHAGVCYNMSDLPQFYDPMKADFKLFDEVKEVLAKR